jgi:hypothetical protein
MDVYLLISYTWKPVTSGKYLSVMFLEKLYKEIRSKSNLKEANLCCCEKQLSTVAKQVFYRDFYHWFSSETQYLGFKLLHKIPGSKEHFPEVHEWTL